MTDQRHTADTITDDALDALYAERDAARSAIDRVRGLASRWVLLRSHGSAASELRAALAGPSPCEQHPHAPTFDGLCGGCAQYPTDMTPETRRA